MTAPVAPITGFITGRDRARHRRAAPSWPLPGGIMQRMLQGLPPVIDAGTRCLILGSFPGEASLALQQYYGHPTNQFWPLLSCALVEPLVQLPYRERLARLAARGVGLWDVVQACERLGSLDAAIRHPQHNDFTALHRRAPA